jgi:hypothetical protein
MLSQTSIHRNVFNEECFPRLGVFAYKHTHGGLRGLSGPAGEAVAGTFTDTVVSRD